MEADGGAGSLRTARGPLSSSAKLLGHLGRGLRRGGGGGVGEEEAAAAAAAAEEEEGSRRREALLRPTLYVHDAMVPVGGETVLAWLDCMSLEFHLNVLMREESVRASGLHVEVVRIDASQPPPWFLALEDEDEDEDGARVGGTAGARRQRQWGGGKGAAAAVAHTVPLLERGGTLHRGLEDISALLCAMFPQLPLSVEFGLNEPRAIGAVLPAAIAFMQSACMPTVWPPSWGGAAMARQAGRRPDTAAKGASATRGQMGRMAALMREQDEEEEVLVGVLSDLEGLLRVHGGPFLHGQAITLADFKLGPRLQNALQGVRHFNGWELPVRTRPPPPLCCRCAARWAGVRWGEGGCLSLRAVQCSAVSASVCPSARPSVCPSPRCVRRGRGMRATDGRRAGAGAAVPGDPSLPDRAAPSPGLPAAALPEPEADGLVSPEHTRHAGAPAAAGGLTPSHSAAAALCRGATVPR